MKIVGNKELSQDRMMKARQGEQRWGRRSENTVKFVNTPDHPGNTLKSAQRGEKSLYRLFYFLLHEPVMSTFVGKKRLRQFES